MIRILFFKGTVSRSKARFKEDCQPTIQFYFFFKGTPHKFTYKLYRVIRTYDSESCRILGYFGYGCASDLERDLYVKNEFPNVVPKSVPSLMHRHIQNITGFGMIPIHMFVYPGKVCM